MSTQHDLLLPVPAHMDPALVESLNTLTTPELHDQIRMIEQSMQFADTRMSEDRDALTLAHIRWVLFERGPIGPRVSQAREMEAAAWKVVEFMAGPHKAALVAYERAIAARLRLERLEEDSQS